MKKLLVAILLLFAAPVHAAVSIPHTHHFLALSPWTSVFGTATIDATQGAPGSSGGALKFTYYEGFPYGNAPDKVYATFSTTLSDMYATYWVKYSDGYLFHPVDNKQTYYVLSGSGTNFYISRYYGKMSIVGQRTGYDSTAFRLTATTAYNPTLADDTWYKITVRAKTNTSGANGIFQLWVNDTLVIDRNNTELLKGSDVGKKFGSMEFTPVYGGGGTVPPKPAEDYQWYDFVSISGEAATGDTTPPYTDTHSPAKGATGWPVDSRTLSWYVRDASNVTRSTISATLQEGAGTPAAMTLTTSPTTTTAGAYLVSYTHTTDFADNTVYTVAFTAQDVYSNTLTESWTFTTAAEFPDALAITTASLGTVKVGATFALTLEGINGQAPYTWDNTTPLPAGMNVPPSGIGDWGVPLEESTDNVTIRLTDAAGATATASLSLTVEASDTPTYPTVMIELPEDAFIKSGETTSNFSSGDQVILYTWPANTISHRAPYMFDLSSIPAGSVPHKAYLMVYATGHEGGGGDNTYSVTVHPVTGVTPVVDNVSWSYYDGVNPWPGGAGGGGDVGASVGTIDMIKTPRYYLVDVTGVVQGWMLSGNKGLMLSTPAIAAADSNRLLASSEHPTAAFRPVLYVTYAPTSIPSPSIVNGILVNGSLN